MEESVEAVFRFKPEIKKKSAREDWCIAGTPMHAGRKCEFILRTLAESDDLVIETSRMSRAWENLHFMGKWGVAGAVPKFVEEDSKKWLEVRGNMAVDDFDLVIWTATRHKPDREGWYQAIYSIKPSGVITGLNAPVNFELFLKVPVYIAELRCDGFLQVGFDEAVSFRACPYPKYGFHESESVRGRTSIEAFRRINRDSDPDNAHAAEIDLRMKGAFGPSTRIKVRREGDESVRVIIWDDTTGSDFRRTLCLSRENYLHLEHGLREEKREMEAG